MDNIINSSRGKVSPLGKLSPSYVGGHVYLLDMKVSRACAVVLCGKLNSAVAEAGPMTPVRLVLRWVTVCSTPHTKSTKATQLGHPSVCRSSEYRR